MSNETPVLPFGLSSSVSGKVEVATASFYRTQYNSNITITIPSGSNSSYLTVNNAIPVLVAGTFNNIQGTSNIGVTPQYFSIQQGTNIVHSIKVLAKMQKADGTNYSNYRELRCYPTKLDGTPYSLSIGSNNQPATGDLENIFVSGKISHSPGDNITLGFQVSQISIGSSDTLLTIFRIDWLAMSV